MSSSPATTLHTLVHNSLPPCLASVALCAALTFWPCQRWSTRRAVAGPPATNLDTLPIEIQSEILCQLDWKDILHVRQVSRQLLHASRQRIVWQSLFQSSLGTPLPDAIFLNKRLSAHSSRELEEAVLRPKKANVAWDRPDVTPRKVSYKKGDKFVKLLPGGRWAFAWNKSTGELVYYDLDAPDPIRTREALLASPFPKDRSGCWAVPPLAIDVDVSSPYLKFNLAIYFDCPTWEKTYYGQEMMQVWQVDPLFDCHHNVVSFKQRLLSLFNPYSIDKSERIQIHGPYVTYFDYVSTIVDWALADGKGKEFVRFYIPDQIQLADVLPDNRILSYDSGNHSIAIHDLPQLPQSTGSDWDEDLPTPLWKTKMPGALDFDASRPLPIHSHDHLRYFLRASNEAIYGLSVPFDRRDDPQVEVVCIEKDNFFPEPTSRFYKNARAIWRPEVNNYTIRFTRFIWSPDAPGFAPSIYQRFLTGVKYRSSMPVMLDEFSNRTVVPPPGAATCIIYDFSL